MLDWITTLVRGMGALGVGLLMFLENVFPPIPSEVIVPLAGFAARQGGISFWGAVVAGVAGSLVGALGWYLVGRREGERRLRAWVDRHGRWLALSGDDVDTATRWFARHGFAAMPLVPFLLYSAAGTAVWTVALAVAGRILGSQYERVSRVLEPAGLAVLGLVLALYAVEVARWRRRPGA